MKASPVQCEYCGSKIFFSERILNLCRIHNVEWIEICIHCKKKNIMRMGVFELPF